MRFLVMITIPLRTPIGRIGLYPVPIARSPSVPSRHTCWVHDNNSHRPSETTALKTPQNHGRDDTWISASRLNRP